MSVYAYIIVNVISERDIVLRPDFLLKGCYGILYFLTFKSTTSYMNVDFLIAGVITRAFIDALNNFKASLVFLSSSLPYK